MREVFAAAGVIPVLVFDDADHAVPTAEALIKGGLDVLEVTLRTNASWSALSNIIDSVPEASVGVGTVLTTDQMKQAKEVGAAFAVSPGFDPTLVACAVDLDLFYMPGVATASEVMQAYAMELRCLKFWGCPRSLSLVCQFDPFFELSQALLGRSFVETPFALFEEQMEVVFGNAVEFS